MRLLRKPVVSVVFAAATCAALVVGIVAATGDFGQDQEHQLKSHANLLFGINQPLDESSTDSITAAKANADPANLATLAGKLSARVVTSGVAGANIDMMALWPNDMDPTYLIACNEQGTSDPGVQRINIATGEATTIVTGTTACDPMHRTPWGTILFGEEAGGGANGGRMYELMDPLNTTGVTLNRATGVFSGGTGAANFAVRAALGRNSFEGLAIYPNGVVYYGDENRPANGTAGGAYFKFVPTTLRNPGDGPITDLTQSPLVAGSVFGLRLGVRAGTADNGQGTQTGLGKWVFVAAAPNADLRALAASLKLTGYYRPEDIAIDQAAMAAGNVRFCAINTGNEGEDQNYGEAICLTDGTIAQAGANAATLKPEVQFLVMGNPELAMPDNIAYQPGTGKWVIHEDGDTGYLRDHNNDLWDCLPDGGDTDLLSDGCVRVASLNDLGAEWTGGLFDATGSRFFVSVQHNVTGKGVVLEITGWK